MPRIARAPPVVGLALGMGSGAALLHLGVHPAWTLLSLLLLLVPDPPSSRPGLGRVAPILAVLAGAALTLAWGRDRAEDCRFHIPENARLRLHGTLVGRLAEGRGELRPTPQPGAGEGPGCLLPLRMVLASGATADTVEGVGPGAPVRVTGAWRRSPGGEGMDPFRAGYLRVDSLVRGSGTPPLWRDPGSLGGRVQERIGRLFPSEGGLVEALVLARKEGLSPEIRESFARAGTAHLLAISGFHVGVVAGLLLLAGGWLGLPHPSRFLLGTVGVWGYVLAIGLPDAALRAALILSLLSLGRWRRRAVAPLGTLASAFIAFIVADPGALLRPGFQLSFAGAAGLVLWARPLGRRLAAAGGVRVPPSLASGLAAGLSATLATLPLVVWHFGRVSLVGIPVTLLAAPLVTLAIPGVFLSLLASLLHPGLGAFLAQGVEAVLWGFRALVEAAAALPLASVWVSRPALVGGVAGVAGASFLLRFLPRSGERGAAGVLALGALSGLLLWPAADRLAGRGELELVVLDVGQGDAILLRSPGARWILVDVGPRTQGFDAGARVVLPYLRRRGVGRLEAVILTHPDMDHVGGAGALLEAFSVATVLDPGMAVGSEVYLDALRAARGRGVPWRVAEAGDSLNLDGVALRILWPPGEGGGEGRGTAPPSPEGMEALLSQDGANAVSLVLEVRYGEFSALLTGDAPAVVEETVLPDLLSSEVALLKVGHHGSRTSTSPELLERLTPEVALVSVGARNRYGHPHAEVLRRLEAGGARVIRTDRWGNVRIRARADGSFRTLPSPKG